MSGAHGTRARADLRAERGWIWTAVLVGLVAGAVLAAGAGARRTASAYDRFLDATHAADVLAIVGCGQPPITERGEPVLAALEACGPEGPARRIGTLDPVAEVSTLHAAIVPVLSTDGRVLNPGGDPCASGPGELTVVARGSGTWSIGADRVQLVSGRMPAEDDDSAEVLVSPELARRAGLAAGDRVQLHLAALDCNEPSTWGPPTEVRIVGVGLMQGEALAERGQHSEGIHLAGGLARRWAAQDGPGIVAIRLAAGSTDEDLARAAAALDLHLVPVLSAAELRQGVVGQHRADVTMLQLVALMGGTAAALVLGVVLARQAVMSARDAPTLVALGWTRRDLRRVALIEGAMVAGVAVLVALMTSISASSRFPLGSARVVEPDPGVRVDGPVLAAGALATALVVVAAWTIGAGTAVRSATSRRPPAPGRRLSRRTATVTTRSAPALAAARLSGRAGSRGDRAPVRVGIASVTMGLIGVIGAITVTTAFDHLAATPAALGWSWDVASGLPEVTETEAERIVTRLLADPGVERASFGTFFWMDRLTGPDGADMLPISVSSNPGHVHPTVIRGRAPTGPSEIAVNAAALDRWRATIGDVVVLANQSEGGPPRRASFEIVGTAVTPYNVHGDALTVLLSWDGIRRLVPGDLPPQVVYVDLDADTSWAAVAHRTDLAATELLEDLGPSRVLEPPALRNRRSPVALTLVLTLMIVGVVAHVVTTMVRRSRRDLALLRCLGFERHHLRRTTAWMVTRTLAVPIVVAVPLGYVLGRAIWLEYVGSLQLLPLAPFPGRSAAVVAVALLVLGNLVGFVAVTRIARRPIGESLRAE